MPRLAQVSRINVLTAIRDHDLHGAAAFVEPLGFDGPVDEVLIERGRRYDARALLAYAHGKATGDYLTPEQLTVSSLKVLTDLGFTVATRAELERPKPAPAVRANAAARPKAVRVARPEPVVRLCPTCFTQLSVTGTCDYCE
ncbi:MAG: hypothetical protein JWP74_3248 [Marmoricola sp.]|nr:hypothetical protein [Marmoricola sp.]